MIIESAFYQLPEELVNAGSSPVGERDVVSSLRNLISERLKHISLTSTPTIDKHYPINKISGSGPKLSVDLHVGVADSMHYHLHRQYIIQGSTWLEAKYYRPATTDARTNITFGKKAQADLKRDILKLCILVEESAGKLRYNSRYFCAVFRTLLSDKLTSPYIPPELGRAEPWLVSLLSPGVSELELTFSEMTPRISLELSLKTITYSFAPLPTLNEPAYLYWGHLVRIFGFTVRLVDLEKGRGELSLTYEEPDGHFSPEMCEIQQEIGKIILEKSYV